jgi:hypothetical protein
VQHRFHPPRPTLLDHLLWSCLPSPADEDKKALETATSELKPVTDYIKKVKGWAVDLRRAGWVDRQGAWNTA